MMKNIGLEPITFCLLGKCSTAWANLSIKSNCCKCLKAGSRTWTRNPFITSEMHYHCAIPAGCFPCWRGNNWCFVIRICKLTVGRRVYSYLLPKVRNVGLEPTRRRHQILSLARLPITPIPQTRRRYLCTDGRHSTRSIMISLMT